ncbi:glutathione S-transferase family protein [Phenylobacterium sp.]|uniref:glutathione S-transferase family protein n=1 Tax=Phenylobacterium sp. TaxID=1871053 RepID=UPI00286B9453|nr:glutathione S-transferase family protein [Phenylobacterium sp.]
MITLSAFRWVPPLAQGLVKDLRVRWALEEAGLPYQVHLIGFEDQGTAAYRGLQPFGQVPAFQEDGLTLFESGAIVLRVAERSAALAPADPQGRARMTAWMFAALNSVEPMIQNLATIDLFESDAEWAKLHRPATEDFACVRLAALSAALGDQDYLEDRFTAGDLLMVSVLRILRHTNLVARYPNLEAYRLRCEARPAFRKALADQMATFRENAPA